MTNLYISTGCQGRTGKGRSDSPVPVGDDQHPRQGAGKVEEEIRLLDPSPPHRWEGGCEGSMGCDTRQPSPRHMGEGATKDGWKGLDDSQLFFMDTRETASYWDYWIHPGAILYHRLDERPLGERERLSPHDTPSPRCFNCGSAEHLLSSCPEPRNRALIDLSRQLFAFFADYSSHNSRRIHEVEEWKSCRLEWIRMYKPGEITGTLLKDALGSRDAHGTPNMPWLENISLWGYPPGWISCEDPAECVRRRILNRDDPHNGGGRLDGDSCWFVVLNDTPEDSEIFQLESPPAHVPSDLPVEDQTPRRWAAYPKTYFLSGLLPPYTGKVLPPLMGEDKLGARCDTFPPRSGAQPPPPPNSPPPLPPPPHDDLFDDEVDMDLSD